MKKIFLLFGALLMFCSVSSANNNENCSKMPSVDNHGYKNECQKEIQKNDCKNSCDEKKSCEKSCNEQEIDDDEYFTYNQCYFDKRYRKLKSVLCLTQRQENCLDNYYQNFKARMERQFEKYTTCKNHLLEAIECDKGCYREQKRALKEIKKDTKEKCKDFKEEINDLLCKNQRKTFKKFQRNEKRKMKKIIKYASVYKLPCVNCCSN